MIRSHTTQWLLRLALGCICLAMPVSAQSPLDDTLSALEEWVQVEKTLSEERTDWALEKQSMEDIVAVYEQELAALEEQVEAAAETTSAADARRAELVEEQDELRRIEKSLENDIIRQEKQLRGLLERLPQPLREEIEPLVQRMPEDPRDTNLSLSQRLQNIVGILTQVDKFNNSVELIPEQRDFGDGAVIEVKTIYFGIGIAYYADKAGLHAGVGVPAADGGWDWKENNTIAADVLDLINMYEGSTTKIRFVPVPATIED